MFPNFQGSFLAWLPLLERVRINKPVVTRDVLSKNMNKKYVTIVWQKSYGQFLK
jgi:hypothetical protein